jgi:hypothetical protein
MEKFDPVPFDETRPEAASQQLEDIPFFAKMQDATSTSHLIPNIITHNSSKEARVVKGVKFDFKRMMQFDGVAIRFAAVLDSTRQLDRDRRFIVSLFPSDDTVSVFKPRQRNSGILGYLWRVIMVRCKFMDKSRILQPDGGEEYYKSSDFFFIGMWRLGNF